tara:strand:- start:219 stop:533 length:315 start_codon:yes stop_codon:yes gene_type:complete
MHLDAIKQTSSAFKHFLKANDIDKVVDMQETLTEMISDACDITEVISSTDSIEGIDEADIENEYLKMVEEIRDVSQVESQIVFPSVPSQQIESKENEQLLVNSY